MCACVCVRAGIRKKEQCRRTGVEKPSRFTVTTAPLRINSTFSFYFILFLCRIHIHALYTHMSYNARENLPDPIITIVPRIHVLFLDSRIDRFSVRIFSYNLPSRPYPILFNALQHIFLSGKLATFFPTPNRKLELRKKTTIFDSISNKIQKLKKFKDSLS